MYYTTPDLQEYNFFKTTKNSFEFHVKCSNDAHILLASTPDQLHPTIEIVLGGNRNTFSAIKKSVKGTSQKLVTQKSFYSTNIVSSNDFKGFWLQWSNGLISCGRKGEFESFMSWKDPNPFEVNFIGIYTGWGATGTWKIGRE